MDGMEDYNGEFLFDSEDNTPSPLPILPDYDSAGDVLKVLDSATAGEDTSYLSPSLTFATPAIETSPQSGSGSHDSLSDSSSSKRTQSTASTKTTLTGGDVMMKDVQEGKDSWQFSDFIHGDDESAQESIYQIPDHTFDHVTNFGPLADQSFTPANSGRGAKSEMASVTSSPSPFAMTADALSPPVSSGPVSRQRKLSPVIARGVRGHAKGNSVSFSSTALRSIHH